MPLSLCDVQQTPKVIHVEQDLSVCTEVERYEFYHAFKCMVKLGYGISVSCVQIRSLCECNTLTLEKVEMHCGLCHCFYSLNEALGALRLGLHP